MKQPIEKLRLMLADDDLDDCEMFQLALEEVGANVTLDIFHDGKSLIEFLRNTGSDIPDIVFLDLNMPILNGLEALREIRSDEQLRELSIAIYSTSNTDKDIEETLASGANIYITKPTSFRSLKEVISKVLKINWQYHSSRLDRNNYCLVI